VIEVTELPGGWECVTLEDVTTPVRIGASPADFPSLPFVGMEHVEAETMRLIATVPASEMRSNSLRFWPGDVLYGRLRPYLNKVLRPDFEGLCSAEFLVFPKSPHLYSGYLQYFLNSWRFKQFASHLNTGDRPRVDWEQLKVFVFPLAPLAEQRRIVDAIEQQFSRLDAGVAALKRTQAALKRYRAAVLKAAVEGRLTETWRAAHPDVEPASRLLERILAERRAKWEADLRAKGKDPAKARYVEPREPDTKGLPELPKGWCCATLEQLSTLVTSGSRGWADYYSDQGTIFIRAQDINTDTLNLLNVAHVTLPSTVEGLRTRVKRNDLLVTITGANVTKTALVHDDLLDAYVNQNVGLDRIVHCTTAPYLYYWVVAPTHGRRMLENKAYGAGKPGLSLDNLRELLVAVPPLPEQDAIVAEVEQRLSVVDALEAAVEANLKRADRLRQSILERAFSGQLVPQDPEDEPASVLLEHIRQERESTQGASNGLSHRTSVRGRQAPDASEHSDVRQGTLL
jgi:type I restriction enzyme S subunit